MAHVFVQEFDYTTTTGNNAQPNVYYNFYGPVQIQTDLTVLLVGARQLMGIHESSVLGNAMEATQLKDRALANLNPPMELIDIQYVWQRLVDRHDTTTTTATDTSNEPVLSNQVQMLATATCDEVNAGPTQCTNSALRTFFQANFPEIQDALLENVKEGSDTNYFRNGGIQRIVLDPQVTEDPPEFVEPPDNLPPIVDYQSPGVQENDTPYWVWLAMLIALGVVGAAVVYVFFCLTARGVQTSLQNRNQNKQQQEEEEKMKENVEEPLPKTKSRTKSKNTTVAVEQPKEEAPVEDEFDVTESNHIEEVPTLTTEKKKKKKKKSKKKSKKKKEAEELA
jgi:hypothetical protein